MKILLSVILFSVLPISTVFAQTSVSAIDDIKQEYQSFHYKKVIEKGTFYLGEPYITQKDSLVIFTYLLNASFTLNNLSQATQFVSDILAISESFNLDPKTNSPKVISFFNIEKKKYKSNNPQQPLNLSESGLKKSKHPPYPSAVLSGGLTVLFPGSGHILENVNHKYYYRSLISAVIISASVYQTLQTNKNERKYLNAKPGADFNREYRAYNASYRLRNGFYLIYFAWGLYSLYDLQSNKKFNVSIEQTKTATELSLYISF